MSAHEAMEWVTVAAVAVLVLTVAAVTFVFVWSAIRDDRRWP